MRRTRTVLAALAAAGAAVMLTATTADAGVPEYQRVIKSRAADGVLVDQDGCVRTEVWVSASDNVFGGRPGPVNKQGLTSVLLRRFDTCADQRTPRPAAAPPPGRVLFDGIGQTLDPLRSTTRFDRAWVDATIPVTDDISGRTVPVHLDIAWTLVGPLQRDTTHLHVRQPHRGIANSHAQTLMGDALIGGKVTVAGAAYHFAPSEGAHLQQVKYGCQIIVHPRGTTDMAC